MTQFRVQAALPEKWFKALLLCASVSLWLTIAQEKRITETQRHREEVQQETFRASQFKL